MTDADAAEQLARRRFALIGLARLAGAVTVVIAVVLSFREPPLLDRPTGFALGLIGMLLFVLWPRLLARRWRTPDQGGREGHEHGDEPR